MSRAAELSRLLYMSADSVDGNEDRNHITGLEHALRVATLAKRHNPAWENVFVGLVHDLARPLSDIYHGEVIAEIVRDLVSRKSYDVLRTHGQYQEWHIHGAKLDSSVPWHREGKALCAWEVASFAKDWAYQTMDLGEALFVINLVCGDRN